MLKRTLDIILSLIGIALALPFFPIIALLIKLDSKGPVFYPVDRVGKDMQPFKMFKFRTMMDAADCIDQSLCPQNDPRVTTIGRFLRRTKLNEFPQLINVLKGDMAFVGPRPESPDLAQLYPETAKPVFSVKPGLVGPNQILGRNEEEMYPPGVDAKKYYIDVILPPKIEVDLEYIKTPRSSGYSIYSHRRQGNPARRNQSPATSKIITRSFIWWPPISFCARAHWRWHTPCASGPTLKTQVRSDLASVSGRLSDDSVVLFFPLRNV